MKSTEDRSTQTAVVNDISAKMSSNNHNLRRALSFRTNGDFMMLHTIRTVGSVSGICNKGMVFQTVVTHQTSPTTSVKKETCGELIG